MAIDPQLDITTRRMNCLPRLEGRVYVTLPFVEGASG